MMMMNKGKLLLANGMEFEGECFGAEGTVIGEIVFTTSATGYQETLRSRLSWANRGTDLSADWQLRHQ